jgi:type II secretory pathway pseudopilin PulG
MRAHSFSKSALPRGRSAAGFTLVELTVALVAGLIVAIGIVSLAKASTQTFHEETRAGAAEAALRTAVDRLRSDLARAGYMSTGNITADPNIAKPLGQASPLSAAAANFVGLARLSSIRLYEGGSTSNTIPLSTQQPTPLSPDAIEIGGNMTSAEEFEVQLVEPPSNGCQRVLLSSASPAILRVAPPSDTQQTTDLRNIFQPVGSSLSTQFIVRIVDDTGRAQFVLTCAENNAAGFDNTGNPYVDIDPTNTPILTSQQTGTQGGISGYAAGRAFVNAVHVVRWEIVGSADEAQGQAQYANALGSLSTGGIDPNKYDLVRSYVDPKSGLPIASTTELVAEYAVDLDFAFSVDSGASAATPNIVTYAFEDNADNDVYAQDVSKEKVSIPGPQRIRSVRARVSTRTALPDRTANIPVSNFGNQTYVYRYCVNNNPSCNTNDGTLRWARARTVTTEVALPNLSRDFF